MSETRRLAFLMFLYAATLFSNAYTLSDAAPVTFQFEATIATVDVSENFTGLPFEVAEGDTIRAALTLSSLGTGPAYAQPISLRFWIANMPLVAPAWEVLVSNDETLGIDLTGRIAEPITTPDHEGNPIGDTIYLRGIANQPFAGEIPGHPEWSFHPTIVLSDERNILSASALPLDESTWNTFERREMSLYFVNTTTGAKAYLGAYVQDFQLVPEPATWAITAAAMAVLLAKKSSRAFDVASRMGITR